MSTNSNQGPPHGGVVYLGDLPYATRHWFSVVTQKAGFHPRFFEVSVTKADPQMWSANVNFVVRVTHMRNGKTMLYEALECVGWVRDFRLDLAAGVFGFVQPAPAAELQAH